MTGVKFTPGPWDARTFALYAGQRKLAHFGPINCLQTSDSTGQSEANAKLAAAAPDLYAAAAEARVLIGLHGQNERLSQAEREGNLNKAWHLLDAALAKAADLTRSSAVGEG